MRKRRFQNFWQGGEFFVFSFLEFNHELTFGMALLAGFKAVAFDFEQQKIGFLVMM